MSDYQDSAPTVEIDKKESDEVSKRANQRWQYVNDVDAFNRKEAKADIEFVWKKGAQWPEQIRLEREAQERPCLEINQMPQFIAHVVNDQRERRPAVKFRPGDKAATPEIAEIYEGHARAIQYESQASAVFDSGFEQAVTCGRGYWRICTEYESDESFNQVIRLRRIPDVMSVYLDPDYQQPDASDIEWAFVAEVLTKDEFERDYPDAQPLDFQAMDTGTIAAKWFDGENKVVVADYFEKVYEPRTLCLMSDGTVTWKDILGEPDAPEEGAPPSNTAKGAPAETYGGARILRERDSQQCRVDWYKVYGAGVLEKYEWAGGYIPIVMCVGNETLIDGERIFQGLIRRARDPQIMFNFWETRITENLALAPNAQWLIPDDSIEGYENIWDEANLRLRTRLPYKHSPNTPPPQRLDPAQAQTGMLTQANQCREDLYSTIGIYPPQIAQSVPDASGRAIDFRQQQSDRGTFHYADNLARAIELTGRIIADLLPKIVDTERDIPTVDEEGKQKMVRVNQRDPVNGNVTNSLAQGKYAVVVDVGPSFATRRMEAAQSMLEFIDKYPAAAPLIGDMIARNQDWADADKIAARLQVMLPPQIQMLEAQAGDDPKVAALVTALQNMQQQSQQTIQGLQGQLQQASMFAQQAKAKLAQVQLTGAKRELASTLAAHNSDVRANAENERTAIEGYRADSERLGEILDFIVDLAKLQQTQTAAIGPEAVGIERQTRGVVASANLQ